MKRLIHKLLMAIIPWKCLGWNSTHALMRVNYWANKEKFDMLAMQGGNHLTQRALDK